MAILSGAYLYFLLLLAALHCLSSAQGNIIVRPLGPKYKPKLTPSDLSVTVYTAANCSTGYSHFIPHRLNYEEGYVPPFDFKAVKLHKNPFPTSYLKKGDLKGFLAFYNVALMSRSNPGQVLGPGETDFYISACETLVKSPNSPGIYNVSSMPLETCIPIAEGMNATCLILKQQAPYKPFPPQATTSAESSPDLRRREEDGRTEPAHGLNDTQALENHINELISETANIAGKMVELMDTLFDRVLDTICDTNGTEMDGGRRGYNRGKLSACDNGPASNGSEEEDGGRRGYNRFSSKTTPPSDDAESESGPADPHKSDGGRRGYNRRSAAEDEENVATGTDPNKSDGGRRGYDHRSDSTDEDAGSNPDKQVGGRRGYNLRSTDEDHRSDPTHPDKSDGGRRGYNHRSADDASGTDPDKQDDRKGYNRRSGEQHPDVDPAAAAAAAKEEFADAGFGLLRPEAGAI